MSEEKVTLPDVVVTPPGAAKPPAAGPAAAGSPGDRGALLLEGYKRGILPPEQKGMVEEAMRRGILKPQENVPGGGTVIGGPTPAPRSPLMQVQPGAAMRGPAAGQGAPSSALADVRKLQADIQAKQRAAAGYDPAVDYDTGTNFTDAVEMDRRSPAQRKDYLEATYGKDKVFQDRGGRFYVEDQGGKKVSPEGHGFVKGFLANLYAEAPKLAGGTLGGIAGGMAGGPPGAVAGAAVGGAVGQGATDLSKAAMPGGLRTTPQEEFGRIGRGGLEMGSGEAAGRFLTGIPGALGSFFRNKIADVTPERQQMAAGILREGGAPPLRSVAPGMTSWIQKQDISTRLGYDPLEAINRQVAHKRLRDVVESAGLSPADRETAIRQILDPTTAISSTEAGQVVSGAVRGRVQAMEDEVERLSQEATRSLDVQLKSLGSRMASPGPLGKSVAEEFQGAWSQFSADAERQYGPIRLLVGDQPLVPTGVIERKARALLEAMPKTAATPARAGPMVRTPTPRGPGILRPGPEVAGSPGSPIFEDANVIDSVRKLMRLDPQISFQDAQRIRSKLGSWSQSDVARDLPKHELEELRQAVDLAFDVAAADPAAAGAVKMLRQADAFYRDGRQKFNNLAINQMVKDVRDGIVPNPTVVADKVLREGQLEQAQTMKRLLKPETWERVAGADWQGMMNASLDPQTGQVVSRRLASEIQARDQSGLLDLTYGGRARDMKLYAQRAAAFDEKIPASMLAPDSFGTTMRFLEAKKAQVDEFMSANFLAKLARPGADADEAIKWIVQPGRQSHLEQAEREFGTASPQMQAIRKQWLIETLHSAIGPTKTGTGSMVTGEGIENALSGYTSKQLEILAPGGLADDMKLLAREIRAMFPARGDQLGGALIAGSIRDMPLFGVPGPRIGRHLGGGRLYQTVKFEALAWIYSQPATVRVLTQGLRSGPGKTATRETIRMLMRAAAAGRLPEHDDRAVQDPAVGAPTRMPTEGTPSSAPGQRSSKSDDYYRNRGYQVPEISPG